MKIKTGINYAMALAGATLLFAAASMEHEAIGLGMGFALLMAGIYRISQHTGQAPGQSLEDKTDESI
jgi:hypothetical protein